MSTCAYNKVICNKGSLWHIGPQLLKLLSRITWIEGIDEVDNYCQRC